VSLFFNFFSLIASAKKSSGLFGDDDDGDDLFGSTSSKAVPSKPVAKPSNGDAAIVAATSEKVVAEPAVESIQAPIATHAVAAAPAVAATPANPVIAQKPAEKKTQTLFGDDDDDDLFGSSKKPAAASNAPASKAPAASLFDTPDPLTQPGNGFVFTYVSNLKCTKADTMNICLFFFFYIQPRRWKRPLRRNPLEHRE
jgi:hypothetical protein